MKASAAVLLALACLTAIVLLPISEQSSVRSLYEQWKAEHGRDLFYTPQEDAYRFKAFQENLRTINEHNSKLGKSYAMGVNQFTCLTKAEFAAAHLFSMPNSPAYIEASSKEASSVKLNVDWVSQGAVSVVKSEGSCLANYAFSTVGALEGVYFIMNKQLIEFSAQELVDCSRSYGNGGCIGGTMYNSYRWEVANGASTRVSYPYDAREHACHTGQKLFRISTYANISSCVELDNALMQRPISVAIDGHNIQHYHSGIFSDCGYNLSYGALLVGGTDYYYTLKTSLSPSFGEGGYMRLQKRQNICGICQAASYPIA